MNPDKLASEKQFSTYNISGISILTLNVPIATSCLLKCLRNLYGKQCGPRSDCSYHWHLLFMVLGAVCSGSTLFASILNLPVMLGNYLQQMTSTDNIFRQAYAWGHNVSQTQSLLLMPTMSTTICVFVEKKKSSPFLDWKSILFRDRMEIEMGPLMSSLEKLIQLHNEVSTMVYEEGFKNRHFDLYDIITWHRVWEW